MFESTNITWKHIILGFLTWGILMLAWSGCMVMENSKRIEDLEKDRQGYLVIGMDTVVSPEGDTTIYETRIYAPQPGGNKRPR